MWVRSLNFDLPLNDDSFFANLEDHVAQFDLIDRFRHDASLAIYHVERGAPKQIKVGMC